MKDVTLKTTTVESVIHCGAGVFEKYAPRFNGGQLFIITDTNVDRLYSDLLNSTFGNNAVKFVIPAGEKSKNPQTLLKILKAMLENGMRRRCCVVAFGGGVVGDVAGLAASLYMRGVKIVQIPTTLLAQVDSSVGGKTAVDMCGVKNVLGSFYQPQEVIADPRFLSTLSKREIRCGLGEVVKYGALNADIFDKLLKNIKNLKSEKFLENITYDCILHKAWIVEKDEHDFCGERKSLNLGHTTGHALELSYGRLSHGEYVLIGAYYELEIAQNLNICGGQYSKDLKKLITTVIKNIPSFDGIERAAEAAVHDKKNEDELISLIVPEARGKWREIKLEKNEYANYLKKISDNLRSGKC